MIFVILFTPVIPSLHSHFFPLYRLTSNLFFPPISLVFSFLSSLFFFFVSSAQHSSHVQIQFTHTSHSSCSLFQIVFLVITLLNLFFLFRSICFFMFLVFPSYVFSFSFHIVLLLFLFLLLRIVFPSPFLHSLLNVSPLDSLCVALSVTFLCFALSVALVLPSLQI